MNCLVFIFLLATALLISPSSPSPDSFIYAGCTRLKYSPGTPYDSAVSSLLASLVNSASISNFNTFNVSFTQTVDDLVYGLYQCRGDLTSSDCHACVAGAVSRMGDICVDTSGAALQLDGCFVKYDNASFVGVEDKTVVYSKCGAPAGYESDVGSRREEVLAYLSGGGQYFRVGGSGGVQGVVQCVQDLSVEECRDCLSAATQRLETECAATSPWGDVFLGKCYARYSQSGGVGGGPSKSESHDDDETEKTLALIIGLIAVVTLLVVFISFYNKNQYDEDGK